MSTACPACCSGRVRTAFRGPPESVLRCRDCGTLFDVDAPSPEELRRLYQGREYFVKDADDFGEAVWGYEDDYLADQQYSEAKFDRVVAHLERYVKPGRLLDVGAGPGFLLLAAQRRGWDPIGVDLNEWAAEYAQGLGVDVRTDDLAHDSFPAESFDAVTLLDVLEHVPDPDDMLEHVARVARPGGAIAVLTPDAGSPVSRLMGRRWPEVRRPGEHTVLFSVRGLAVALARHGFASSGWHSIGKTAPIDTLVADVSRLAPRWTGPLRAVVADRAIGQRVVELDPRTKFCLYARKQPGSRRPPVRVPPRVPRRPEQLADVDDAILEELETMADAEHLSAWMFAGFQHHVPGAAVLEVGGGIGTFTRKMLEEDAKYIHVVEPEAVCAEVIERMFAEEARVTTSRDALPDAPSVAAREGTFDLAVCQNVLEHIGDDSGALAAMARALRPGGRLVLVVPAEPWLFGALDDAYGHWRRYSSDDLDDVVSGVGLEIEELRPMNALGIPGWWVKNRRPGARIGRTAFRAYESLVTVWRPLEESLRPPVGLSLVCIARKPG